MRARVTLASVLSLLTTVGCAGPGRTELAPIAITTNDWVAQAQAEALLLLMSPQLSNLADQESYAGALRPARRLEPGKTYYVDFGDKVGPAERADILERVRQVSSSIRSYDPREAAGPKPTVRYRVNVVERRGDAAVLIGGSALVGDGDGAFYTFVYVNLGGRPYLTAINVTAIM